MVKQTKMGWKATLGTTVLGYFPSQELAQAAIEAKSGGRSRAEAKAELFSSENEGEES